MAGFKDIIGHEQIIEHLQNAIGMDKVSHAYIINGPDNPAVPRLTIFLASFPQVRISFLCNI